MNKSSVIKAYATLPIRHVTVKDYMSYGADNLYPQQLINMVAGTAALCISRKAQFIEGNGFTDNNFYTAVINNKHEQVDDILGEVCADLAFFSGFALLINYDATLKICAVDHIPFEKCRQGLPDDADYISKIAVVNRIDSFTRNFGIKRNGVEFFDVFNPAQQVVRSQIEREGGIENYRGQVLYYFHKKQGCRYYPKPEYDKVLHDIEAETALKISRKRDIKSGFSAKTLITKFGSARPAEEVKAEDRKDLKEFVGEEGAVIYLEYADNPESATRLQSFQAPDASIRYRTDGEAIKSDIMDCFAIPTILYGREVAGKLGTSQEFAEAVKYVQRLVVNKDQRAIERTFKRIFENFTKPVNLSKDYSIQNLSIEQAQVTTQA